MLTSSSRICLMRAVFWNARKSQPWRRLTMFPLPLIAHWVRLLLPPAFSWIAARPMSLFRNRASAFITTRETIC